MSDTAIRAKLAALERELRQAREPLTGPHGMDPTHCPTFHDGCHCTVDTLVHNIERAEAAEKKLEQVRAVRRGWPGWDDDTALDDDLFDSADGRLVRWSDLEMILNA